MASDARARALVSALAGAVACTTLACGGGSVRRFPLRDPMWKDTDTATIHMPCHPDPKKEGHEICTPATYESSFAWDGADNMVFRPMVRFFAVDPGGESTNVNAFDEVPDSSWFTNRIGAAPMGAAAVASGSCGERVLDPSAPDGSWLIDEGKPNGANPGFRVNVPGLGKFMLKADPPDQPERATGATSIAARLYHAAGWFAPCDSVVYFRPSLLKLKPGLKFADNSGVSRTFDEAALAKVLAGASHRGELVRMVASRWLPGRTIGPFTYAGVREDDPNDIVPHEDRRDLRGARVIAAWLAHFDSREQNTMNTWMADDPQDPDAGAGHIQHWYIDLGDCFGSEWAWEGISKRLNHAYYFDVGYTVEDFLTLGIIERPWDRAKRSPDGDIFGFFSSRDFDPDGWRGGYPNPAFGRMTERDAAWAARVIARFTPELVESALDVGDYTKPEHRAFLRKHVLLRQRGILERYFAKLSPLADVRVEAPGQLCAKDLARWAHVYPEDRFHYDATAHSGPDFDTHARLGVRVDADGGVCTALPRVAGDGGAPDDDASRYMMVDLTNGQAEGPLRAHLYDLGPTKGYRLVGLERL